MQLALDKFGRMVLPKIMRDDLGIRPGDTLDACEEGDTIVLRPLRTDDAVRQKDGVLVFTGAATGDIAGAVAEHRRKRLDRLHG